MILKAKVVDSTHLELLTPVHFDKGRNLSLILHDVSEDNGRTEWSKISAVSLGEAYGDTEPEYSVDNRIPI